MAQYIDKDALVAEIENIEATSICEFKSNQSRYAEGSLDAINRMKSFLNTLEVKEVDLEEEINHWQGCEAFPEGVNITPLPKAMDIVERTAKHFFELGFKSQKGE